MLFHENRDCWYSIGCLFAIVYGVGHNGVGGLIDTCVHYTREGGSPLCREPFP